MKELTILNERAIRLRKQNSDLLKQICNTYRKQEIKWETEKEEIRSAVLGTVLPFLICALFIAIWIIFGY